ncbi:MAG: terminase, partial [Candidatus Omnitrophica bacterium]|nr:terminase [Candidatus Omnitrophota bacterium]
VPEVEVDAAVHDAFERYDVWRMYADPPYWQGWIAAWAGKYNLNNKPGDEKIIEWWTNRRKQMSYALEDFDTAIKTGTISHDGDKNLARHIANAFREELTMKDETGKRLWLIRKERPDSPNKIDLAMCAVLSWTARKDAVALGIDGDNKSIYESRGALVF